MSKKDNNPKGNTGTLEAAKDTGVQNQNQNKQIHKEALGRNTQQ